MKVLPLFLLTLSITWSACAQYCLVMDIDGFVNVRKAPDNKGGIDDTLNNGHLVFILTGEEQAGNWRKVQFVHNGKTQVGYVYNNRLIPIAHYDSIPLRNIIDNTGTFSCDSVKVIVVTQKFDKTKYRLTYDKQNSSQIIAINGKEYWGTDGDLPKREYKSIVIFVGARKITLPPEAFDNVFQPTVHDTEIRYNRAADLFYIHAENGDGAGAYDVIWRVVKGVYTDRDMELDF
jgi:hypothetical protein